MPESASRVGVSGPGGSCAWSGGGVWSGGCAWPGGVVCLVWGVSGPGGSASAPCGIPPPTPHPPRSRHTSPPVNRMTNRCKNITLATTSLRPVNIYIVFALADPRWLSGTSPHTPAVQILSFSCSFGQKICKILDPPLVWMVM